MHLRATRVESVHLGFLSIVIVLAVATSLPAKEPTDIQTIAVLDSLTGDSTVVDGNVVYVDFWASWCVPCRRSLPWMAGLEARYKDRGLQIITINVDREADTGGAFLEKMGVSLPVVYDPDGNLARLYDLQVMPSSFVYGRDGTLRASHAGFNPDESGALESQIVTLLDEEKKP
jgi:thiol-disulfide isomerase/thioredoxin